MHDPAAAASCAPAAALLTAACAASSSDSSCCRWNPSTRCCDRLLKSCSALASSAVVNALKCTSSSSTTWLSSWQARSSGGTEVAQEARWSKARPGSKVHGATHLQDPLQDDQKGVLCLLLQMITLSATSLTVVLQLSASSLRSATRAGHAGVGHACVNIVFCPNRTKYAAQCTMQTLAPCCVHL